MSGTSYYYIVADIDGTPRYVARDGGYSDDFDMALRFNDRDAAEFYRAAMSEKYKAKVLRFMT